MNILDVISLDEFVPIVCLISILTVVGTLMCPPQSVAAQWAGRIAAASFIAYAVAGLISWPPGRVADVLPIVMRAILASALIWAIGRVSFPFVYFAYDYSIGRALRQMEQAKIREWWVRKGQIIDSLRRIIDFWNQKELEKEERRTEAEPPPRKSKDEIARDAKERYERAMAIIEGAGMADDESEAAKLKAKQQYLRELDEAI